MQKFANVLKSLGVKKGDRVAIYMGMTPELPIAMLACARIGAPHSVVFGGFSANALVDRIHDSQAWPSSRRTDPTAAAPKSNLFPAVEEALKSCPTVKHVVVYKRTGTAINMQEGRDHWWHELMAKASDDCPAEPLDAEHPLYILYTSGTTGNPRASCTPPAATRSAPTSPPNGFSTFKDEDTYWCTADIGWVTGHSYIVYGPLQNGATSLMYEGAPNFPEPDRFWSIIERHKVNVFYTAPTAIRAFIKWGDEWPKKHELEQPAPAGHRGRADQSRSVDVVPRNHRRQPLPHRRYLVADRNRHDHDHAHSRRDCDQARLGHAPVPRRRRRGRHHGGQARA